MDGCCRTKSKCHNGAKGLLLLTKNARASGASSLSSESYSSNPSAIPCIEACSKVFACYLWKSGSLIGLILFSLDRDRNVGVVILKETL